MKSTRLFSVIAVILALFLTSCAGTGSSMGFVSRAPISSAAQTQYNRALAVMKKKDYKLALKKFRTLSVKYPEFAGPRANIGIIYTRKGQYKKAETAFKEAIELNPDNPEIYNELGVLYRHVGKFNESLDAYQRALSIKSDYAFAHLNMGILYDLYLRKGGKALKHYQRYQELVKNDKLVNKWIVDLKLRMKRNEKVVQR